MDLLLLPGCYEVTPNSQELVIDKKPRRILGESWYAVPSGENEHAYFRTTKMENDDPSAPVLLRHEIRQRIDGELVENTVTVLCKDDPYLTPTNIKCEVKVAGRSVPEASSWATIRYRLPYGDSQGVLTGTVAGRRVQLQVPQQTLAQTSLYHIVPKLPFERGDVLAYNNLSETELAIQRHHTISYSGQERVTLEGQETRLHRFDSTIGMKFWVNDQHELVRSLFKRELILVTRQKAMEALGLETGTADIHEPNVTTSNGQEAEQEIVRQRWYIAYSHDSPVGYIHSALRKTGDLSAPLLFVHKHYMGKRGKRGVHGESTTQILCKNDPYFTPVRIDHSASVWGLIPIRRASARIDYRFPYGYSDGILDGKIWPERIAQGPTVSIVVPEHTVAISNILEIIPRLPFKAGQVFEYTALYEEHAMLEMNNKISYLGKQDVRFNGRTRTFHSFLRSSGRLLTYYYVDDHHQLVLVRTGRDQLIQTSEEEAKSRWHDFESNGTLKSE